MAADERPDEGELTHAERDWAKDLLKGDGDKFRFAAWVQKENSKGAIQARMLIIGSYRVTSVKKSLTGKSVARCGHFYDLRRIESREPRKLRIEFAEFDISFTTTDGMFDSIVRQLLVCYTEISLNFPPHLHPTLVWDQGREAPVWPAWPTLTFDGFLEHYRAHCLHFNMPIDEGFIGSMNVEMAFERKLSLTTMKGIRVTDGGNTVSIKPVVFALQYNQWFRQVDISDIFRPDAVLAMAAALLKNSNINEIYLRGVGAAKGFAEMSKAFTTNTNVQLVVLDLSRNIMHDKGMIALSEGLSMLSLTKLDVSYCEFRAAGVAALTKALINGPNISNTLLELTLAGNTVGTSGSISIVNWMNEVNPCIQRLNLAETSPDMVVLSEGLPSCPQLEALNVTGAKFTTKGSTLFGDAIEKSGSLVELNLSRANIAPNPLQLVLQRLAMNQDRRAAGGAAFVADGIDFGGATGTGVMMKAFKDNSSVLAALSINKNQLGARGFAIVCETLNKNCKMIRELRIMDNIGKNDPDVDKAMTALASLINNSALEILHIRASEGYALGAALVPVIRAVGASPNLQFIDFACNKTGDDGAVALRDAIRSERCGLVHFTFDDNAFTLAGMNSIADSIPGHRTLRYFDWPEVDMQLIYSQICRLKKRDSEGLKIRFNEMKNRLMAFLQSNVARNPVKRSLDVFGVDLDAVMSRYDPPRDVPIMIERVMEYLQRTSLDVDGIFRVPGPAQFIKELRDALNKDENFDFECDENYKDSHCVAATLKLFLRELPEPLLPFKMFDAFCATSKIPDHSVSKPQIKALLLTIPQHNFLLIRELLRFVQLVSTHSETNRMTIPNLVIVFGPNLLRPEHETLSSMMDMTAQAQVIQHLIESWDFFFSEDEAPPPMPPRPVSVERVPEPVDFDADALARAVSPVPVPAPTRPPVLNDSAPVYVMPERPVQRRSFNPSSFGGLSYTDFAPRPTRDYAASDAPRPSGYSYTGNDRATRHQSMAVGSAAAPLEKPIRPRGLSIQNHGQKDGPGPKPEKPSVYMTT